ncbi:MAG: hypothetical protein K2N58_06830 [Treponemataceae bacterium]|nr:hypothetical protein [Treponemataceae bacterium]
MQRNAGSETPVAIAPPLCAKASCIANSFPTLNKYPKTAIDALSAFNKHLETVVDGLPALDKYPKTMVYGFTALDKHPKTAVDALPVLNKCPKTAVDGISSHKKYVKTAVDGFALKLVARVFEENSVGKPKACDVDGFASLNGHKNCGVLL